MDRSDNSVRNLAGLLDHGEIESARPLQPCNLHGRAPFPGGEGNIQFWIVDAHQHRFVSIYSL